MNTKIIVSIMLLSLLTAILYTATSIKPVAANPDAIYINSSSTNKNPSDLNSFFDVYVDVQINDLFAFDLNITWNNDLIAFSTLENSSLYSVWPQGFYEPLPLPGYQTGVGYVRFAAVATGGSGYNNTGHLFRLTFQVAKASNFELSTLIHFKTVKLSDSQANSISVTVTDGTYTMNAQKPDLEFEFIGTNSTKVGATFQIKLNATDCYDLDDYNLTILYDHSLLSLTSVDWTGGVLGDTSDQASYTESPAGTINIVDTGGLTWTGKNGFLFTLTFTVYFSGNTAPHIWRTNNQGPLYAFIKLDNATLSFLEGTITKTGITLPTDLHIVVNLIQGDINLDGSVDAVFDLRTVAAYFDKTSDDPDWSTGLNISQYDIRADGISAGVIDIFDLVLVASQIT
jgi:hypothetical protein